MSATHTTHMNLSKPDRADLVSVVNDLNNNLDIIDDKYGAMETMRIVPYSIGVGEWTLDGGVYKATFSSAYITATSKEFAFPDESYISYAKAHILGEKHSGGGGWDFQTSVIPTGTIKGSMYVFDAPDGKVPVLIEDTVVSIANGGTGESTLAGAKSTLGVTAIENNVSLHDFGTFTSQATLESTLATFMNNMSVGETQEITFLVSTGTWTDFAGSIYTGKIEKALSNRCYITLMSGANGFGSVNGTYINSVFKWFSVTDKIGNFKIEKYEGTLSTSSATNTFNTGITFTSYANVGIVVGNYARSTRSDGILYWELNKNGTLEISKATASWGGTNKIYVTVIHD